MKTNLKVLALAALFAWVSQASHAGPVGPLTTFTAGTAAKASEVNGNFTAVSTAVNANDGRITTLEATVSGGNVTLAGNIVLVPSAAITGNILKGTFPFIHNFGTDNTFIGLNAGNLTMSGAQNTASGARALQVNTTGSANTACGSDALRFNTTGFNNTAIGEGTLANNTTGTNNTASGMSALTNNTTGFNNTAAGLNALGNNTTGANNTAVGLGALQGNTTGGVNTASGWGALSNNTTGSSNVAVGFSALGANTTGFDNTGIGQSALGNVTTGTDNIAIGNGAGLNQTTGNFNIYIGAAGVAAESSTLRINTTTGLAATFIGGIRGTTITGGGPVLADANGQLGTNPSSRRFKDDITDMGTASSALMTLRPVTFYYKSDKNPKGRSLQYGLVAEEVVKVAPGLVGHSADGKIETVYYQFLAPMLLNEVQKQQRTIAAQTARIAHLEKQSAEVAELKQQVTRMAGMLARLEGREKLAAADR